MKGRTTIRFTGGALDGTVEEIQSKGATEELTWPKGNYFSVLDNGDIGVMNAGPEGFHQEWFGYSVEVYQKAFRTGSEIPYEYKVDRMIGRCAAITKTGKRCQHIHIAKGKYCPTHKNHTGESVPDELIV